MMIKEYDETCFGGGDARVPAAVWRDAMHGASANQPLYRSSVNTRKIKRLVLWNTSDKSVGKQVTLSKDCKTSGKMIFSGNQSFSSVGGGRGLRRPPQRKTKAKLNVRISLAHALARKLSQKLHRIHIEIRNFVRVQYSYQHFFHSTREIKQRLPACAHALIAD